MLDGGSMFLFQQVRTRCIVGKGQCDVGSRHGTVISRKSNFSKSDSFVRDPRKSPSTYLKLFTQNREAFRPLFEAVWCMNFVMKARHTAVVRCWFSPRAKAKHKSILMQLNRLWCYGSGACQGWWVLVQAGVREAYKSMGMSGRNVHYSERVEWVTYCFKCLILFPNDYRNVEGQIEMKPASGSNR
jgi:hypothetical protein